jgi:hypothetical protein
VTDLNIGAAREFWLQPTDDTGSTNLNSFLVRDDASVKTGQQLGRTIRLGDPVNLGPNSNWRQLSWEGGVKQEVWRDEAMYHEGNADTRRLTGKFRMHPGWESVLKFRARTNMSYMVMCPGGGNSDFDTPQHLYLAEHHILTTTKNPPGGFRFYQYSPQTGKVHTVTGGPANGTREFTNICPAIQDGSVLKHLYVSTRTKVYQYKDEWGSNTWVEDTGSGGGAELETMVSFNDALYYGQGTKLRKRKPAPPYGVLGTHTTVKDFKSAFRVQGLCVWNNRLWFTVYFPGNRTSVFVSDGNNVSHAFDVPVEFVPARVIAHYGSLYVVGSKVSARGWSDGIAQVYKYTGSSLSLLWQASDGFYGFPQWTYGVTTLGPYLYWSINGYKQDPEQNPLGAPQACIMGYDPEHDAIFQGPTMEFPPQMPPAVAGTQNGTIQAPNVCAFDGGLVAHFIDYSEYPTQSAGPPTHVIVKTRFDRDLFNFPRHKMDWDGRNGTDLRVTDYSFGQVAAGTHVRSEWIRTSRYHGEDDVATENKTWLSAKLRVRLKGQHSRVRVSAFLDESTTEIDCGTVAYDSSDEGWRTAVLPLKVNDEYLQSCVIQFKVYVENFDPDPNSIANPEVDTMDVEWVPKPTLRRSWRFLVVASDDQERLNGDANPLTTGSAIADKLQEIWAARKPVKFWEANPGGGTSGTAVEVLLHEFSEQSFRLESTDDQVARWISVTFNENVVS